MREASTHASSTDMLVAQTGKTVRHRCGGIGGASLGAQLRAAAGC
jgi:hypothetical protein